MDLERLVGPTGIVAFVLFAAALVNGVPRFRMLRFHAATGYSCCLAVLVHSVAAVWCHMIEPLGVLASVGMLLTTASGFFRWKLRVHILLAVLTFVFSLLHVALIMYLKGSL